MELLSTFKEKGAFFRFHNSRVTAALLLSLLLPIGSTAMAASATKKVSIIFADFSERSGPVAISANEKIRGLRAEDLIDDRTVRRLEQKGLFQANPR